MKFPCERCPLGRPAAHLETRQFQGGPAGAETPGVCEGPNVGSVGVLMMVLMVILMVVWW